MRFLIGMMLGIMASGALMSQPGMQQRLTDELARFRHFPQAIEPVRVPESRRASDPAPGGNEAGIADAESATDAGRAESREPGPETGAEEDAASQPSFQVAWSPFRSEASATGFASELQARTDHPFVVTRIGVGRYQVGFEFETAEEREALLAAIDRFTGYMPKVSPTGVER